MRTGVRSLTLATIAAVAAGGCGTPAGRTRADVSRDVEARFGPPGVPCPPADRVFIPDAVAAGLPLPEDGAVVLALWNNAAFREALVELDLTRADLVTAGLLPNPDVVYWWPEPNKPFKYLIDFPVEAAFLRPIRLKAAAAENERAAGRVTQLALDLIRDTRQAYADLQLAHDRLRVAERSVALRERVAGLAVSRQQAGDATPLEVSTARVDALQAVQDRTRSAYEITVAAERLRNLTGLSDLPIPLLPDNAPVGPGVDLSVDELVADAVQSRPDAQAAASAVRAAAERVRVAKLGWVRVLGILDATSGRVTGHEFGPALRMSVPIFNRNQGGVARADAELDQLERRERTVHNQIVLDVRQAHARFSQARAELDVLRTKTRPEVEEAIRRAEAAYKEGNVTYLIVLELNRQLIDTSAREAVLFGDLRRAWAELERGVGRKLGP